MDSRMFLVNTEWFYFQQNAIFGFEPTHENCQKCRQTEACAAALPA